MTPPRCVIEWMERDRMWAVLWRDPEGVTVVGNYTSISEAEAAAIEASIEEEARRG